MNRSATIISALLLSASSALAQATAFSGTYAVAPNWTHSKSNGSAVVYEQVGAIAHQAHTFGTNAWQMNAFWRFVGALTNGEVRTFNLKAATNSFGDVLAFSRINFMAVKVATNATGDFVLDGSEENSSQLWHDGSGCGTSVQPGGVLAVTAPSATGIPVAINACNFDVTNTGTNAAVVEIYIGGVAQ
jgi:hypothetical protein